MNIGWELSRMASERPDALAVVEPAGRGTGGRWRYRTISFRDLDQDSTRIAAGLQDYGVVWATRLALLVKPGIDFVSLVFALFKAGAVIVLIDPGMGRENLLQCLEQSEAEGFVAIPLAHAARVLHRRRFPRARWNVTVGRRWFWGGKTLGQLRRSMHTFRPLETDPEDPAAVIFTTGSTGPPKGVLYSHRNFAYQVRQIQGHYDIQPGEVDLAAFPLFALFNCAMGVTTVFPAMDFTRPAHVDPRNILAHAQDWQPTQSFGSPAFWNSLAKYCETHNRRLPTIRRALSAGAPVAPHVLRRVKAAIAEGGEIHTPYGATESLPVSSISGSEVLGETAAPSERGAGTCVGRRFSEIEWKVIRITDHPLEGVEAIEELPPGAIGELIVRGPVVTASYVTRHEWNALAKIKDRSGFWHRMGDCGYLDRHDRFWFCGRKSHRVTTTHGVLFTVPCEAIANRHPHVYRSALVGLGNGTQTPVMIVETWPEHRPADDSSRERLLDEVHDYLQRSELTRSIGRCHVLWHYEFPVDIRHNAKIFREKLVPWAARRATAGPDAMVRQPMRP